ncbi:hypothetical protein [Bacteroides thetaiotaomicron]|uniref:hypothetical protein n=1 Tax=Bacteroides thetaiotaomicron TaxID=818 RepID=UPI0021641E75|nr:hypothetical protein [Bacteroides thetaiotaomicron]UVR89050.1 hypothetical protein NXV61_13095 [Bacteroides thetaiotaomicron]
MIARSSALLLFINTLVEREDKESLFMKTKKQTFNGSELAMLFQAFARKLFIRPQKGDIFSVSTHSADNSCDFYFRLDYYELLEKDFQEAYTLGKFAQSNANKEWVNLMKKIQSAQDTFLEDSSSLEDYYESVNLFWK